MKIFTKDIFDKEMLSKIQEEFIKFNNKEINNKMSNSIFGLDVDIVSLKRKSLGWSLIFASTNNPCRVIILPISLGQKDSCTENKNK